MICTRIASLAWALAVLLSVPGVRAAEPTLDQLVGHWKGLIDLPGLKLPIDLDFAKVEAGGLTADISIPMQQVNDMPITDVSLAEGAYSFRFPGAPGNATFKGTLNDEGTALTGTFLQSGMQFPFELSRGKSPAAAAGEALAGIEADITRALKELEVPGAAVAVVKDGQVILARGFGQRDVERDLPVTERTLFAIGSSTKAFTTFVMGVLDDEGVLDLDQPVVRALPDFQLKDETATKLMTPQDLVSHVSGLPRHDVLWYNSCYSRQDMFDRLRHLEPNATFRGRWQYNNLMFLTAGYLIERLSGMTWEDAVQRKILGPLGMTRTNFSVSDSQADDDHALPYDERQDKLTAIPFRDISTIGPAGSINSCALDMSRWLLVHLGGGTVDGTALIQKSTLESLHQPRAIIPQPPENGIVTIGYAMGWFCDVYRGVRRIHHGGNIDGFSAQAAFFPDHGLGIVALTNRSGTPAPNLITNVIADRVLALEAKDWIGEAKAEMDVAEALGKEAEKKKEDTRLPNAPHSKPLADYAGDYEHAGYGVASVQMKDGRLELTYNRMAIPFEHWHYDVFSGLETSSEVIGKGLKIQFLMNIRGEIDRLEMPLEPSIAPIVFSRKPDAQLSDPAYLERFAGEYEMGPQVLTVERRASALWLTVPGQPVYELAPLRNNTFRITIIDGFIIRFIMNEDGTVKEMHSDQPNGLFIATRRAR